MKKKKVSLSQLLEGLDESKFTCYYCDKMFCNRKFLNEHYKKHLDSNGTFVLGNPEMMNYCLETSSRKEHVAKRLRSPWGNMQIEKMFTIAVHCHVIACPFSC